VRGQGLLCAIDLVDPKTRAPLAKPECEKLFRACLERGLLTMAYSPRVRINPPLVITEAEAKEGVDILEEAMAALESRKS
ncbi:MAG: Aminotransferase, partial [bacterium]|nr:Aminotransferase [bacterium]